MNKHKEMAKHLLDSIELKEEDKICAGTLGIITLRYKETLKEILNE
jgi:hypothetical protein